MELRSMITPWIAPGDFAPRAPEFNVYSRKMNRGCRSGRRDLAPTSPSFSCPTQALGFALQRHPILLVGRVIFGAEMGCLGKIISLRRLIYPQSIIEYTLSLLSFLIHCSITGDHLNIFNKRPNYEKFIVDCPLYF